jgi:hypothetical protein
LVKRTLEVIEDKKKRTEMAKASIDSVHHYSLEEFERKIQAIFL